MFRVVILHVHTFIYFFTTWWCFIYTNSVSKDYDVVNTQRSLLNKRLISFVVTSNEWLTTFESVLKSETSNRVYTLMQSD